MSQTSPLIAKEPAEWVILIHGFLGAPSDLSNLETAFQDAGYQTITPDFETRKADISTMADQVITASIDAIPKNATTHMVTHSMGGLLARAYFEKHPEANIKNVVMIAPPNKGSEVAEELSQYPLYQDFAGPAGQELGALNLTPEKVGHYNLGIIAGTASVNPLFSRILPGKDDGYVALSSTPLEGMDDFIEIPSSHGLITGNESTIAQSLYFIENGKFDHDLEITGFPISTDDFLTSQD